MADSTEEKKIRFSAEGGSLLNFFKQAQSEFQKFQKEGKSIVDTFAQMAKESGAVGKDQYRFVQDSLKALKEQLKIQKEITKEKQAANKLAQEANQENNAISSSVRNERDKRLKDEENLLNQQFKSYDDRSRAVGYGNTQNQRGRQDDKPKSSFFNDFIKAELLRDITGMFRQSVSAQTGLDLIPSSIAMGGTGLGALLGAPIGASAAGAQIGKDIGQSTGQGIARHIIEKERYEAAASGVYGLTGNGSVAGDMSRFGIDRSSGVQLEQQIIRSIGKSTNKDQIANVAAISKFGNIDQGNIFGLMKTARMGGQYNERDIIDMFASGMNRSQLNEGTQKLTAILQHQSQTMGELTSTGAMKRVLIGDQLGGPFSTIDPRSSGLESTYMDKLSNPQGGFAQAVSFAALQKAYPGKSLLEYKKLQQAGGIKYEGAMQDIYQNMTGNSDINTLLYSQGFGSGIVDFDERRLKGSKVFNNGSFGKLGDSSFGDTDKAMNQAYKEAEMLTTKMQKDIASVNNAFIIGFTDGIETIATQFTSRFGDAIDDLVSIKINKMLGINTSKNPLSAIPAKTKGGSADNFTVDSRGKVVRK